DGRGGHRHSELVLHHGAKRSARELDLAFLATTPADQQADADREQTTEESDTDRLRFAARGLREAARRRRSGRRRRAAAALVTDLPQVALDDRAELELAARRERDLVRRDRRLVIAIRRSAPHAALRLVALDRSGPPVADRVARLEVVLRRRRRAVLETLL